MLKKLVFPCFLAMIVSTAAAPAFATHTRATVTATDSATVGDTFIFQIRALNGVTVLDSGTAVLLANGTADAAAIAIVGSWTSVVSAATKVGVGNITIDRPTGGDFRCFVSGDNGAGYIEIPPAGTVNGITISPNNSTHGIPTLSEWGVILLMGLILLGGLFTLRRKPTAPQAA